MRCRDVVLIVFFLFFPVMMTRIIEGVARFRGHQEETLNASHVVNTFIQDRWIP